MCINLISSLKNYNISFFYNLIKYDGFENIPFLAFFKCNLLILLSTYFPNLTFYECIKFITKLCFISLLLNIVFYRPFNS